MAGLHRVDAGLRRPKRDPHHAGVERSRFARSDGADRAKALAYDDHLRAMRIGVVAVVLIGLHPAGAHAFECTSGKTCATTLKWPERTLRYTVRLPPEGEDRRAEFEAATAEAFGVWSAPACTDLAFIHERTVIQASELENENEVALILSGWQTELGNHRDAVGLTTVGYTGSNGHIGRGRIEINEEHFDLADADTECPARPVRDLASVLVHEAGHFIGFAHPCEYVFDEDEKRCGRPFCTALLENGQPPEDITTMWPNIDTCDTRYRTLTVDDLDGLCTIYPAGTEARACRSLEVTVDAIVTNRPFGCRTGGRLPDNQGSAVGLAGLVIAGWLCRRRRE